MHSDDHRGLVDLLSTTYHVPLCTLPGTLWVPKNTEEAPEIHMRDNCLFNLQLPELLYVNPSYLWLRRQKDKAALATPTASNTRKLGPQGMSESRELGTSQYEISSSFVFAPSVSPGGNIRTVRLT